MQGPARGSSLLVLSANHLSALRVECSLCRVIASRCARDSSAGKMLSQVQHVHATDTFAAKINALCGRVALLSPENIHSRASTNNNNSDARCSMSKRPRHCAQMLPRHPRLLLFHPKKENFYDYDEPIGMCSRLIIHNLTRASSGLRLSAACRRVSFSFADFYSMTCCRK